MGLPKKLSDDQVREIRRSSLSQKRAAVKYNVSSRTIGNIRRGVTYKHVPARPPIPPDVHHRFARKYCVGDVVKRLEEVPDSYAETILTMPPPTCADDRQFVHRERRIIEECLRIAGEFGVVICVYHPRFRDDGVVDLGTGILEGFPLRQVLIWNWSLPHKPPVDPAGRGLRVAQNYANIYILSGRFWTVPDHAAARFRYSNSIWSIPPPNRTNAPPEFPLELARRCIALGRGRVLDPHAGTGTTALAAEEAERVWTLFDDTDAYRDNFERRRDGEGDPDPPPMSPSRRRESAGHGHA